MKVTATLFLLLILSAPAALGQTTTYTVTTTQDALAENPTLGDGVCDDVDPGTAGMQCSLRQAVSEANATGGDVVINLPGQLAGGQSGSYTLTQVAPNDASNTYENDNQFGDLDVGANGAAFSSLTILGTGTPGPTVSISPNDRVFHVLSGTVSIERVTVTGGTARKGNDGVSAPGPDESVDGEDGDDGGCILVASAATATLDQVAVSGCATSSGGNGAAPAAAGTDGGDAGSGGRGGGVANFGTLTVTRSFVAENQAGDAGSPGNGTSGDGSPVAGGNGGSGGLGGGIFNAGTLTVEETTVFGNLGGDPSEGASGTNGGPAGYDGEGGAGGVATLDGGATTLRNTIVAGNTAGDDVNNDGTTAEQTKQPGSDLYDGTPADNDDTTGFPGFTPGTYATEGFNLIGTNNSVEETFPASPDETSYNANNDLVGTGQGDQASRIDPDITGRNQNDDEAIANYVLAAGSPAIDRGADTDIAGMQIAVDGRGFERPGTRQGDAGVDIGGYEFESQPLVATLVISEIDAVTAGDAAEFVEIENTSDVPAQLADYALVFFDRDNTACYSVNLRGELAAGATYVVGDPGVSPDQLFSEGFAYEDCPPPSAPGGDQDETTVDENVLDDQTGAVALYRGKATDYPNGTQAGQNADTREDVVVYDNGSGSGGSALTASLTAASLAMDPGLCGAFGLSSDCAATGDTEDTSISRDPDGDGFTAGSPSPGQNNPPDPRADLQLELTSTPEQVSNPGEQVTLTLQVVNNSMGVANPVTATGVSVETRLTMNLAFQSSTGSCTDDSGTVTCQLGSIAAGDTVMVDVVATASSQGAYSAFAEVESSNETDPDSAPGNDADQVADEDDEASTDGTVLPVELTAFEATLDGDRVRLSWATASETNNSGFAVERSVAEGAWTDVAWVAGSGTTLEAQSYSALDTDAAFEAETVRYRLRQVDLDGTPAYGPVAEVRFGAPSADAITGIWPSPVAASASVRLSLAREGHVRASVYDVLGREVAVLMDGFEPAGRTRVALDAGSLAAGTYFVRVTTERGTLTEQITVAR